MVKHLTFLRWWIMATLVGFLSYLLFKFGVFAEVWNTDSTFISASIFTCFWIMTFWCGAKTFKLSKSVGLYRNQQVISEVQNQEKIGWFAADIFTLAGFVGTIWGMIVALQGFEGINPSDLQSVQRLISSLVHGVSIALYTTLTGLICSLLLKVQYFNLSYVVERESNG